MYKRRIKIGSAVVSGATLGYIGGNIPGSILGGYYSYQVANKLLDKNGNTKKLF